MDLATIIILAGTLIGAIVFLADKHVHSNTVATRRYLLTKFKEIKAKNLKLQEELEEVIVIGSTWGAFIDSDTNVVEYLETLRERTEIEYSDLQYNKLQKERLNKELISEYVEKFRYHQEVLMTLSQDLIKYKDFLESDCKAKISFSS